MRDLISIFEEPTTDFHALVLEKIEACSEKFGRLSLSSGNCGMFSLAMCRYLKSLDQTADMAMIYRDDSEPYAENLQDIINLETDIYHIVIEYDGKYYDGTGEINTQYLAQFAYDHYHDTECGFFREIDVDDKHMMSIIANDTNWSIPAAEFETFMHNDKAA